MRRHWVILILLVAGAAWFQAWFAGVTLAQGALNPRELSGVYTRALAAGRSYVVTNPGTEHIYHDSSLYHGREYMYFGIVPFVGFMVPFYLASGLVPPPAAGVVLFLGCGYAAYGGILLLALRRQGQSASTFLAAAAFACVIFCNGTWFLLGQAVIYELENAAAFGLLAASLLCVALFEFGVARGGGALAAAAAAASLIMGCRPDYLPAVACIALWAAWRATALGFSRASRARAVGAALAPMLAVAVALAWWNYHRFDSPTDFGIVHTVPELATPDPNRPLASLRFTPYFLYRYVAGSAHVERYFPFIQGQNISRLRPDPYQQEGDEIYGFLLITPVLLFSLLAIWRSIRRQSYWSAPLSLVLGACFAGNLGFLCLVAIGCYRYPADFLGPLTLLAAFGILSIVDLRSSWTRGLLTVALVPALAWSVVCTVLVMVSIAQINQVIDLRHPEVFGPLSRTFNGPVYLYERIAHDPPRAVAVNLRLPANAAGRSEPLLVDGQIGAQDFLYLYYAGPGLLQIGFESSGLGGVRSPQLLVDYAADHRVEIRYGSFLPPDDHPLLKILAPADRALARRMLTVLFDGVVVLDGWADFHAPRAAFWVGTSPWDFAFGQRFTGQVLSVEHPALRLDFSPTRWKRDAYGPLSFSYSPIPMPPGVSDPLVSIGLMPQSGQLLLQHQGGDRVRLVWVGPGGRQSEGDEFAWPAGEERRLDLDVGSLYPAVPSSLWGSMPLPERLARKAQLRVTVDALPRLVRQVGSPEATPAAVAVGRDTLDILPGVMPTAGGRLIGLQRRPW